MKRIIHSIGDPTGVGPEITAKVLQRLQDFEPFDLTVIGSLRSLNDAAAELNLTLPEASHIHYAAVENILPGCVAFQSIKEGVELIAEGKADALVTGPISKRNLAAAQITFQGHTEILEDLTHTCFNLPDAKAEMLFVYKNFRLMLLTRHIPLREVSAALADTVSVARSFTVLIEFLSQKLGIKEPRLSLLGVNPHAGEIGGTEETSIFKPLLQKLTDAHSAIVDGPFAADAFFRSFDPASNMYDAIVAPYHDQGLIPFKLLAGYGAVNMTIGLPFIRTSVGHGTAEDIVGKGIAKDDGLMAAFHTALESL